jgi:hypothetical protein
MGAPVRKPRAPWLVRLARKLGASEWRTGWRLRLNYWKLGCWMFRSVLPLIWWMCGGFSPPGWVTTDIRRNFDTNLRYRGQVRHYFGTLWTDVRFLQFTRVDMAGASEKTLLAQRPSR